MKRFLFFSIIILTTSTATKAQFLGQQSLSESSSVIDQSGNLWVWGRNDESQLGLGDRIDRDTPVMVPIPTGATRWTLVAAGPNFTIALADSDKLYAWGLNDRGQIGIGTAGGDYGGPMRIQNPPFTTKWKWVSCGASHCEALTTDGRLYAWGDNQSGELGVGNTQYVTTPQLVEFPTGVTAWADVAAGPGYTMMIAQNGFLYGCGIDSSETFIPWEGPRLARADTFRSLSPLACLAASYQFESRIDEMYTQNADGYFDTTDDGGFIPTVAEVAAGGHHLLVLIDDGSIAAQGDNSFGQLTQPIFNNVLVRFPSGVSQFIAVAAGLNHSLAIGNDGWLYAWGDNAHGELGMGNTVESSTPTRILRVSPPLTFDANFEVAPRSSGYSFTIGLQMKNFGTSSLTNGNAFLALGAVIDYATGAPNAYFASPLAPSDTSDVEWGTTVGQQLLLDSIFAPNYFAYVQATGSSPMLLPNPAPAPRPIPWKTCTAANVVDSLTDQPLGDAELQFPGPPAYWYGPYGTQPFDSDKMVSDSEGIFSLCSHGPIFDFQGLVVVYPINIARENYRSQVGVIPEPYETPTTFFLGPADLRGTFNIGAPPLTVDSIVKVFYPDSLIGYALSRHIILRTSDEGVHWLPLYETPIDLNDVRFIDPGHGFVVGDSGTIMETSDSGVTWNLPRLTGKNLNAIAYDGFDTVWIVGDSGTLLHGEGTQWTVVPVGTKKNFTSISFFDSTHGVIGSDNLYYLYRRGKWSQHTIGMNIQSVFELSPSVIFLGGTNGKIVCYNDSNYVPNPINVLLPPIVDTLITDSTFSTQTIRSIYFITHDIGFVAADSGNSLVTYDRGTTWARMLEFPRTATSMNFFGLEGHGATDNEVLNYSGTPSPVKGAVRGRITFGNPPEPISGAEVDRLYESDSFTNLMAYTYTTGQGWFAFGSLDTIFPYQYVIHFTDSGIRKMHTFANVSTHPGEIVTLNYNDYAPPVQPPDSVLAVTEGAVGTLSLEVFLSNGFANIRYSVPDAGVVRIAVQDVLGRTLREVTNGFSPSGSYSEMIPIEELFSGAYYVTLTSSDGSITRKFQIVR